MMKLITNKAEIARCQQQLEKSLQRSLPNNEILSIGYQGGKLENKVYYNDSLWYSTFLLDKGVSRKRYWNAFGLGKRQNGNQIIIVEINPSISGSSKQVAGLFAKDELTDTYFILHRGKVGGGRSGIGKEAFRNWYRGRWVDVFDDTGNKEEVILLDSISSPVLARKIQEFVHEVAQFKEEATTGKKTRISPSLEKNITFDPEFHGTKKGKRTSTFEYESYHGLIVNSLEKEIKKELHQNQTVFNTTLIDLGIQEAGRTIMIYEVKSSANRQSIYTGIGQLMFHSSGNANIKKTLVLPYEDYEQNFTEILDSLSIQVKTYIINDNSEVIFRT